MNTLKAIESSDHGDAAANEGGAVSNMIVVSEWDADAFHHRVSDLEMQGYITRRETYRVTPEWIRRPDELSTCTRLSCARPTWIRRFEFEME